MPTYRDVQNFVRHRDGFVPKSCWIAHVLSDHGMTKRHAINRADPNRRKHPCPAHRRAAVEQALRNLGMLNLLAIKEA